jgi:hypothetical protein
MNKQILQVTIFKGKNPKTKLGKWIYWKVYFTIFRIWKPLIIGKFYMILSTIFLALLPKTKRDEILKEFIDVKIVLKDDKNT